MAERGGDGLCPRGYKHTGKLTPVGPEEPLTLETHGEGTWQKLEVDVVLVTVLNLWSHSTA